MSSPPVNTPVNSVGRAASCSPFFSTDKAKSPINVPTERAAPAVDRRAAQHDRGDGVELVAGAGIGSRLAQMRHVDESGNARHEARQHIDQQRAAARRECPAYRAPAALNPIVYSARPKTDRCSST